ncbi:MAG TPA: C4-type zinc ribbon domain-containing protein [Chthoniobacterales bacterium]
MLTEIEQLLALQDRDQRVLSLKKELTSLPAEQKARETQLAQAAARLDQSKIRAKQIEIDRKRLEGEVKAKEDTINRYKQQQLQTRKNEEYSALAHEIEAAGKVIGALEDQELALMEESDLLKPQIAQAETAFQEDKKHIEAHLHGLGVKKINLEAQLAEFEKLSEQTAAGVEEDLLDRYRRLFKTKEGRAVVALDPDHEVCAGCHMKVTTQTVVEVKAEKSVVHCPQCGRILFLEP